MLCWLYIIFPIIPINIGINNITVGYIHIKSQQAAIVGGMDYVLNIVQQIAIPTPHEWIS